MAKSKELAGYVKENVREGGGIKMARGKTAKPGATRVAKNGYHYTKQQDGTWKLTHWITAEQKLDRPLADDESVRFIDKDARNRPYDEDGIIIIKKRKGSLRQRRARIEARIEELQAELKTINAQLNDK